MSSSALIPGLNRRVRNAIYDHIFDNDDHEVGGILVGHLGAGDLPVITAVIPALEADGQRASVTFTHEAWSEIHETLDRDYPDRQIVGWYHSHPGFGIFLSKHDRFIHDNFFSDPRQVAYVVDPHAGTEGVFAWHDKELRLLEERPTDRPGTGIGGRQGIAQTRKGGRRINLPFPWQYGALALLLLAVAAVILVIGTGSSSPPAVQPGSKTTTSTTTATTPSTTPHSHSAAATAHRAGPAQVVYTPPTAASKGRASTAGATASATATAITGSTEPAASG